MGGACGTLPVEREICAEFWLGNVKERDHLEYLGIDGKIILKCMLQNQDKTTCSGLFWIRILQLSTCCAHGNELSVSIKFGEFFYVSHTVHYKTINWRKINKKMHQNCVSFLKLIYLFIAPTCFGCSLATIRVLVIWYSGRTMCLFSKIQLFK